MNQEIIPQETPQLVATQLQRQFKYEDLILDDPNPNWDAIRVQDHYSGVYPQLTNAQVATNGMVGSKIEFEFQVVVGTKG